MALAAHFMGLCRNGSGTTFYLGVCDAMGLAAPGFCSVAHPKSHAATFDFNAKNTIPDVNKSMLTPNHDFDAKNVMFTPKT